MKFLHSMIRTKDEKEAKRFYCDFLGLKEGKRLRLEDCYLQYLTDPVTGVEIELTINDEKQEYTQGSAFGHFAFSVDSFDNFYLKMQKLGIDWLYEPFFLPDNDIKIAFIKDPDGYEIELIQK